MGTVNGRTYAFVGLERIGGVMIYDITDPSAVTFRNYVNSRNYSADIYDDANRRRRKSFSAGCYFFAR